MNQVEPATPVEILLVEDDPGDVLMTREALQDSKLLHSLQVLDNGEEAVRYLRRESPYADVDRPDLVILDLNLPRLDGRELLSIIKTDPELRRIPCVVLTTSDAEEDVLRSYDLHANAYRHQAGGLRGLREGRPPDRRVLLHDRTASSASRKP